jgi:DNA-binding NarL/FixJ family response regulator
VVLIDKQTLARVGIENVLASHPDINVIASVKDVAESDFENADVDVIIMGGGDDNTTLGLAALPVRCPTVLIREAASLAGAVAAVLRSGPVGIVSRTTDPDELLLAIEAVTRGGSYICTEMVAAISSGAESPTDPGKPELAPRELETATLLAEGLTHRQISRRMGVTEATVSTYVKRLRAKLNVGNKAELTRRVIELGHVTLHNR